MDKHATKLYNQWQKERRNKRRLVIVGLVIVGLGVYFIPKYFFNSSGQTAKTPADRRSISLPKGTPDYTTLIPEGKSIDSLGGWTRISPTGSNPVYSYADNLNKISITVSQQPLPADFVSNPTSGVRTLATNSGATRHLTANDQVEVYIGADPNGRQSLFLAKKGLLILIKSTGLIPDDQWLDYINSLR